MSHIQGRYRMILQWFIVLPALTQIIGNSATAQCPVVPHRVLVNSRPVARRGATHVLQLLQRQTGSFRIVRDVRTQPLVVVDGIALSGGIKRLSEIRVEEAVAVKVLQPHEATVRYGNRAADGAIEVVTKNRATRCRS